MDATQFREAARAAVEDIIEYFNNLPSYPPASLVSPGYLRPQLPSSAPIHPEPHTSLLADVKSKILPGLTHWQSPRFMAFFPATVTYPSILGEMFSAAFTAPAFNWICSPACTELETVVLDWVAQILGLGQDFMSTGEGGGVIQGSASEAVVVAMVAARERWVQAKLKEEGLWPEVEGESEAMRLNREDRAVEIRGKLVALGSEQAHSSTQKGANILGVRFRKVPATKETGFAMTGHALKTKIEELKRQGLEPFYVTATLGTTNTCAVDDFESIAAVKKEYPGLWVHVDAAYAGSALICPEYRGIAKSKWLGEFESFNMNLHKWMLVNFDASCMWVRKRTELTSAFSITPAYLINAHSESGLVTDYRDWQIPLGRRFRALKIWFVLRTYGVEAIQKLVREHVRLGEVFAELVRSEEGRASGLEIVSGPTFALTTVRCLSSGHETASATSQVNGESNRDEEMNDFGRKARAIDGDMSFDEKTNAFTKKVYDLMLKRGDFFLTSTVVDGIYCIRVVCASERAEEKYIHSCYRKLLEAVKDADAE